MKPVLVTRSNETDDLFWRSSGLGGRVIWRVPELRWWNLSLSMAVGLSHQTDGIFLESPRGQDPSTRASIGRRSAIVNAIGSVHQRG